jgi:hypothetical protein
MCRNETTPAPIIIHRPKFPRALVRLLIGALTVFGAEMALASEAGAQCSARDSLQNQLALKKEPSATMPPIPIKSAVNVPAWKTITVGTFANSFALRDALDAASCGIEASAAEILTRSTFALFATKTDVDLLVVSAAELGFETDTAPLASIYARAQQLGFGLAAAEVAPELRLQYFDQPIGEFLIIGMEPIRTWRGEPVILNVANGGAGLILFGQDGSADAEISVASRFLFVRSNELELAKAANALDKAAALAPARILPYSSCSIRTRCKARFRFGLSPTSGSGQSRPFDSAPLTSGLPPF